MDLPWGDEKTGQFITNVGLISSNGPVGNNLMAAEWTHHVSYSPGVIAVCINNSNKATSENIRKTKEFGVNICSVEQVKLARISGRNTGKEVDKITALKELGFEFYKAKKIDVLMVKDAALNAECKLVKEINTGSHSMFLGEVIEAGVSGKKPAVYHKGRYWKLGEEIPVPSEKEMQGIQKVIEKHRK
ncbi:MAG: flavin reductase family protein [archaeon]